jgi:hypothetical protein
VSSAVPPDGNETTRADRTDVDRTDADRRTTAAETPLSRKEVVARQKERFRDRSLIISRGDMS